MLAAKAPQADFIVDPNYVPLDMVIAWPQGQVDDLLVKIQTALKPSGAIWLVIPKNSSHALGATLESVQSAALPLGLVDNKTLTFSATEYGIRFVIRRELRK